jgi:hypothetical protein
MNPAREPASKTPFHPIPLAGLCMPRQEACRRHNVVSAVDTGKSWAQKGIGRPGAGTTEIGRDLGSAQTEGIRFPFIF